MSLCWCTGGMPLSPTAASTTVGSPSPFTFSCSVSMSAAGDAVSSVFELNKPVTPSSSLLLRSASTGDVCDVSDAHVSVQCDLSTGLEWSMIRTDRQTHV